MNDKLTKEKILDLIEKSRSQLSSLGVVSIGLFGSFVRGDADKNSDVDILVDFDPTMKNYDNFYDTCCLLEKLFKRKVDVVTRESLSPYIGPYILKGVEYATLSS
jgi:predicted nucleotidyltransferase